MTLFEYFKQLNLDLTHSQLAEIIRLAGEELERFAGSRCTVCGSEKTYYTTAVHCSHCASTIKTTL